MPQRDSNRPDRADTRDDATIIVATDVPLPRQVLQTGVISLQRRAGNRAVQLLPARGSLQRQLTPEQREAAEDSVGHMEPLDENTIYLWNFGVNEATLRPEHQAALRAFCGRLARRLGLLVPGHRYFVSVGYASTTGGEELNGDLSTRRAAAVSAFLQGLPSLAHWDAGHFDHSGAGPTARGDTWKRNRGVLVRFHRDTHGEAAARRRRDDDFEQKLDAAWPVVKQLLLRIPRDRMMHLWYPTGLFFSTYFPAVPTFMTSRTSTRLREPLPEPDGHAPEGEPEFSGGRCETLREVLENVQLSEVGDAIRLFIGRAQEAWDLRNTYEAQLAPARELGGGSMIASELDLYNELEVRMITRNRSSVNYWLGHR